MNKSMYFEYVQKYFPQLVLSIVERVNEKKGLSYLYKMLLSPEFSADGRWASVTAEYSRVCADVVSLDSELPLKKRDSLEKVTGDIPKLGMKLYLTEKQMKDIDAMIATNMPINQIINKIFSDTPRCIEGVWERLEDMFLSELSTGVGLNPDNNGVGIRIDVGYLDDHKFGVAQSWADPNAKAIDDLQRVFDKALADQNTITDMWVDDTWLNNFYKNKQAREQYAFDMNFVGQNIPNLDLTKASAVLMTRFGVTLHRVARKIKAEINGVRTNHTPWATGMCVFTCDEKVGKLVWTTTAESSRKVAGVKYETADSYILVSKYSKNDPLREFTSSQAMVVPIIDNVDRIYTQDCQFADESSQSEGDEVFDYNGEKYLKSQIVSALAELGVSVKAGITDAELQSVINSLSVAKKKKLFEKVSPIEESSSSSSAN